MPAPQPREPVLYEYKCTFCGVVNTRPHRMGRLVCVACKHSF